MNAHKIRQDFPIFQRPLRSGNPLIYLENAGTTHKPQQVIDCISSFYSTANASVHRAMYEHGELATEQYEAAREKIAAFINAKHREEIIFTKGATEGINLIAAGWGLNHLKPGDEIVLTQLEHHANLVPWQQVAKKTGAKLVFIPINKKTFYLENPLSYIGPRTKLVAVTLISNVIGPVWNDEEHELEKLIAAAHQHGACVLLDATQAVAHHTVDVQKLEADFFAFSAHKMLGPTGIGALYIAQKHHNAVEPYQFGGAMIYNVSYTEATWAPSPLKYEAGTPPIASVIGFGATIDYITANIDYQQLEQHESTLCHTLIQQLEAMPEITILGQVQRMKKEGHLIAFAINGAHPHDVAAVLGTKGIAVRPGNFCAQPLVNHLGYDSLLRVSLAAYNTTEDVEAFLRELPAAIQMFV